MFYIKDCETLIKHFLSKKESMNNIKENAVNNDDKIIDSLLVKIFFDIREGDLTLYKKKMDDCYTKDVVKINCISQLNDDTINEKNQFISKRVIKTINNDSTYILRYNCKIKSKPINIQLVVFDDILSDDLIESYDKCAYFIYIWMTILGTYKIKDFNKKISINIYFTDEKKNLPIGYFETLNSNHVNSGFTSNNTMGHKIVIYRKEEWFKVFIHETFHHFNLDFVSKNYTFKNKRMRELFPINSEFNIEEGYVETWARIFNSCFVSYFMLEDKNDKSEFLRYSKFHLQLERVFATYQMVKVLNYMGMKYENLYYKNTVSSNLRSYLYKEDTNVFCYFVIPCIFLNQLPDFLLWCDKNNTSFIKFKSSQSNVDNFITLISTLFKNKELLKTVNMIESGYNKYDKKMPNILSNTMRMVMIEHF